jgi:hypothetical protein
MSFTDPSALDAELERLGEVGRARQQGSLRGPGLFNLDPVQFLLDQTMAYRSGRYNDTTRSGLVAQTDAYHEIINEVRRIGGEDAAARLRNPVDIAHGFSGRAAWDVAGNIDDFLNDDISVPTYMSRYQIVDPYVRFEGELGRIIRDNPEAYGDLMERASRAAVQERALALQRSSYDAMGEYMGGRNMFDQFARSLYLLPGTVIGGVSTGSIEQVSQFGATGGAMTALNLGERFVVGGAANFFAGLAVEPALAAAARERGEQYGLDRTALNLFINTAFGGALSAPGFRPPASGGDWMVGEWRPGRMASDGSPPPVRGPLNPGAPIAPDIAGTLESVDQSGLARDLATAREAADTLGVPGAAELDEVQRRLDAVTRSGDAEAMIVAADNFINGESAIAPVRMPERAPDVEPELFTPPRTPDGDFREVTFQTPEGPVQRLRGTAIMDGARIARLQFDPAAFQFRQAGRGNRRGSTGRMDSVARFDPDASGEIRVFVATDGAEFVADGHQRVGMEQRLVGEGNGDNIQQRAFLYREADGWTRQDVSDLAAQANMKQGTADPVDVATLLRRAPQLIDNSVPLDRNMIVAQNLARLSNDAWAFVRDGQLDPRYGAIIASENVPVGKQRALAEYFVKHPMTLGTAQHMASVARQSEVAASMAAQLDMFGSTESLVALQNRVEIMQGALALLRQEKRLFQMANDRASELEAAGNVIARDENERNRALADLLVARLETLSQQHGPVSDLLTATTERAAREAMSMKAASRSYADDLMSMVEDGGLQSLTTPPPARPDPPKEIPAPLETATTGRDAEVYARAVAADEEILNGELAEMAVLQAWEGVEGLPLADDAIIDPDLMDRVQHAMEALGFDDPTIEEPAARLLARALADEAMVAAARQRSLPRGLELEPRPRTFQEAIETPDKNEEVDVLSFADADALADALGRATIPELHAALRDMGMNADVPRTRREFETEIIGAWHDAQNMSQQEFAYRLPSIDEALAMIPSPQRKSNGGIRTAIIEAALTPEVYPGGGTRWPRIGEIARRVQEQGHFPGESIASVVERITPHMERMRARGIKFSKATDVPFEDTPEAKAIRAAEMREAQAINRAEEDGQIWRLLYESGEPPTLGQLAARFRMSIDEVQAAIVRAQRARIDAADAAYLEGLRTNGQKIPTNLQGTNVTLREVIQIAVMERVGPRNRKLTLSEMIAEIDQLGLGHPVGGDFLTPNLKVFMSRTRAGIAKADREGRLDVFARAFDVSEAHLREYAEIGSPGSRRPNSSDFGRKARDAMREAMARPEVLADPSLARLIKIGRAASPESSDASLKFYASRTRTEFGLSNTVVRWTEAEDAQLVRLRRQGMGNAEIAAVIGDTTPDAVNNRLAILKARGAVFPPGKPRGAPAGARSYLNERNARILELLDEMQPVRNAKSGAANPNARIGENLDNGYRAIAEKLRQEGYGEVTNNVIKGVVNRNGGRARAAPSASDEAAAARLGMSVERYRRFKLSARNSEYAMSDGSGGLTVDEAWDALARNPVERAFWNKMREWNRIRIVQNESELPTDGFGEFAFNVTRTQEGRQGVVRTYTASGAVKALSGWTWRRGDGRVMSAWIKGDVPEVFFGQMVGRNTLPTIMRMDTADLKTSLDTLSVVLSVIGEDLRLTGKPMLIFRAAANQRSIVDADMGRQSDLLTLYTRMMQNLKPPPGYEVHRLDSGRGFAFIRSDLVREAGSPQLAIEQQISGARFQAWVRDPEELGGTGKVYKGADHREAIESADDPAAIERMNSVYEPVENPEHVGFIVGGKQLNREDGMAAMRERAGGRRMAYEAEQEFWNNLYDGATNRPRYGATPGQASGKRGIAGTHMQGVAYLVADNVGRADIRSFAIHELTHVVMAKLPLEQRMQMFHRVRMLGEGKTPDPAIEAGFQHARAVRTPEGLMESEALAYAMQHSNPALWSEGLRGLIRSIVARVRYELARMGWGDIGELSFNDMRDMTMAAISSQGPNRGFVEPRYEFMYDYPDVNDPLNAARMALGDAERQAGVFNDLRNCT